MKLLAIAIIVILALSACSSGSEEVKKKPSDEMEITIEPDRQLPVNHTRNRPDLLDKHGVRQIVIENCLAHSSCYRNVYICNEEGYIVKHYPPMINSWYKWTYDDAGKPTNSFTMTSLENGDSIWLEKHYSYFDSDSVLQKTYSHESAGEPQLVGISKYRYLNSSLKNRTDTQTDSVSMGSLAYPCGIDLPGEHLAIYHYFTSGLIHYAQIFNNKKELEVELEYNYYDAQGEKMELE